MRADGNDEQQLVEAAIGGDGAASGKLLSRYQHRLYNIVLRMVSHRDDAAELTQEAMLRILEHISDFRGGSNMYTWMVRIAMNLSISHLRKRQVRRTVSLDAETGHANQTGPLRNRLADTREPSPVQNVQKKQMIGQLYAALDRLDGTFRCVLVLRDIEQMSYQQIAKVLDTAEGTVKSRLFRARLALRKEMKRLDGDPDNGINLPDRRGSGELTDG